MDRMSQEEWKLLYFDRISPTLSVGTNFNWKLAALRAPANEECLLATCMWNGRRVMIVRPWKHAYPNIGRAKWYQRKFLLD